MEWFSGPTFVTRVTKLLGRCGIKPELMKEGRVAIQLTLERSYGIEIEEWGPFARLTGHTYIHFAPTQCPDGLLANLLLRNGEAGSGGWRLMVSDNKIWICYCYSIPRKQLNLASLKTGLEVVLTEVNRFAFEYRYFKRA